MYLYLDKFGRTIYPGMVIQHSDTTKETVSSFGFSDLCIEADWHERYLLSELADQMGILREWRIVGWARSLYTTRR